MVPDEPNHTRLRAVGQSLTAYRKVRCPLRPRHAQVCWELLRPSGRHRLARLHHLQGGVVIHCYRTSHSFGVDGGSLYTGETSCGQEHRLHHWASEPGAPNATLELTTDKQELESITGPARSSKAHWTGQERPALHCSSLPIIRPRAGQELESITESTLRAHYLQLTTDNPTEGRPGARKHH